MAFGSGDGGQAIPNPHEEAQSQIELLREQARLDQQKADADRARSQADHQQLVTKAQAKQNAAYGSASDYGKAEVGRRGFDQGLVDKYGVLGSFQDTIDRNKSSLSEDDVNPVLGERTAFDDAVSTGQNTYRGNLNRDLGTFLGNDYATSSFGDTSDDSILSSILDQQQADAQGTVDAAHSRGTLNDQGYNKALQRLAQQRSGGNSRAQSLGGGVLAGYRQRLNDMIGGDRQRVNNAGFDSPYDLNSAEGGLQSLRDSLTGSLHDDVMGAVGDTSFFDPNSLIAYGGANQGQTNPSAIAGDTQNPLLASFLPQGAKKATTFSTGSSGVF
jgi:hypothetical protein